MKKYILLIFGIFFFNACNHVKDNGGTSLISIPIENRIEREKLDFVYYEEIYFNKSKFIFTSTELDLFVNFYYEEENNPIVFNSGVQIDFFFPNDVQVFKNTEGIYFILIPLYPNDKEEGIVHEIDVNKKSVHSFCRTTGIDEYFKFTENLKGSRYRV